MELRGASSPPPAPTKRSTESNALGRGEENSLTVRRLYLLKPGGEEGEKPVRKKTGTWQDSHVPWELKASQIRTE